MKLLRMFFIPSLLLAGLLTGCSVYLGCTATHSCSSSSTTQVATDPADVHAAMVDNLKKSGFVLSENSNVLQAEWVREKDRVTFTDYLQGSIVISFPEGMLLCDIKTLIAATPKPEPTYLMQYIDTAKTQGYAKTKEQPSCAPVS